MTDKIALIRLRDGSMHRAADPAEIAAAKLAGGIVKLIIDTAEDVDNPLDGIDSLLIACDAIASVVAQKCPLELQAKSAVRLAEHLVGSVKSWTDDLANAPKVS